MPTGPTLQNTPQWFPSQFEARRASNPLYQTPQNAGNQFNNYGPGSQNPSVTNPSQGFIVVNGHVQKASDYARTNPQEWNTLFQGAGGAAPTPAGSPGSQFPTALPLNSFEQAINDARAAMDRANAANERRYNQALANTSNQGKLIDTAFAGIGSRIDEDNTLAAADQARIMQNATGLGDFAISEAKRAGASNEARATSGALSRGMFGSTVLDSLRRREGEATNRNVADLTERKIGIQTGLAQTAAQSAQAGRLRRADVDQNAFSARYQQLGDRRNVILSRQDVGPDPTDIAALISNREIGQASARAQKSNGAGLAAGLGLIGTIGGALIGGPAGAAVGGGLAGLASGGAGRYTGVIPSDRRLKTNVRPAGSREVDGEEVPEFTYRYTAAAKRAGKGKPGKFKGPMAQSMPKDEVATDPDGFGMIRAKYRKKVSR